MTSNEIDYITLHSDSDSGKTNFVVENGAVVHHLDSPIIPSADPNITNIHTQITDSSNVRIGHEYHHQYQAPVNIYVENFQFPANLEIIDKVKISDNNNPDKSYKTDDENIKSYKKIYNKFRNLSRKSQIIIITGLGVGVLLIITTIILLSLPQDMGNFMDSTSTPTTTPEDDSTESPSTPPATDSTTSITTTNIPEPEIVAKLISRDEWEANEASMVKILVPPKIVILGDIKCSECDDVDTCKEVVREIQRKDMMNSSFADIRYNFLVAKDGTVYEGTGFEYQGRHTFDFGATYYENTLGIFFIGNLTDEFLNDSQIKAVQTLIKNGTEKGLLENKPGIYNRYELESGVNRWNLFNISGIEEKKKGVLIISKIDWGGELTNAFERINAKTKVVISHIPEYPACDSLETCKESLQKLQQKDKNKGRVDIIYNFMVSKNGLIFAGRNWDISGEIPDVDNNLINVGFIGNFSETGPDPGVLQTVDRLLKQGKNFEKLDNNYIVYGERDLNPFSKSPGEKLYEELKNFPNFQSNSNKTMYNF